MCEVDLPLPSASLCCGLNPLPVFVKPSGHFLFATSLVRRRCCRCRRFILRQLILVRVIKVHIRSARARQRSAECRLQIHWIQTILIFKHLRCNKVYLIRDICAGWGSKLTLKDAVSRSLRSELDIRVERSDLVGRVCPRSPVWCSMLNVVIIGFCELCTNRSYCLQWLLFIVSSNFRCPKCG